MKLDFWVKRLSLLAFTVSLTSLLAKPGLTATFQPPADNTAPRQATGGASRGEFIPPANNNAPRQATGGASRGEFIPPANNSAPRQASGGASRAEFVLPNDNTAPQQASGGASRAEFVLPNDNAAPQQAAGGASRAEFILPSDQTSPDQTVGGSSRTNLYGSNPALSSSLSMMAVMPESFYGTTLLERPTFMAYLPASGVQEAVFSVKDEAGNLVYRAVVPISGDAGIVAISMPAEAPALEVDKNYQWFVALKLDGRLTPNSPFVDGWIRRIEPASALAEPLVEGDVLADAEALAESGVWYDSAALFAQLRIEQPENSEIARHWEEFLNSVSLDELLDASIEVASLSN